MSQRTAHNLHTATTIHVVIGKK